VWFEVEVLQASRGYGAGFEVGFAGTNFRGEQLGKDERGWGINIDCAARHRRAGGGGGGGG
jgi:hypothetical protein